MRCKQSIFPDFLNPTLFVITLVCLATVLMITTPASAMNKGELVDAIASGANLSKADAKRALEALVANATRRIMPPDRRNYIAAHPHGWIEIEMVSMDLKGFSSCILDVTLNGENFVKADLLPNGNRGFLFNAPVGEATLEVSASGECMASNIGSSGEDGVGSDGDVKDASKDRTVIIVTENIINAFEFTLFPSRVEAFRTDGTGTGAGSVHITKIGAFYGMNINGDGLPTNAVLACGIFGDPGFPPYYCVDSFFDVSYAMGIDGVDSFLDVFTKLSIDGSDKFIKTLTQHYRGNFAVDSFFDVFTEIGIKNSDSFFDAFTKLGISSVDSFFDIMYNTHKHHGHITVLK